VIVCHGAHHITPQARYKRCRAARPSFFRAGGANGQIGVPIACASGRPDAGAMIGPILLAEIAFWPLTPPDARRTIPSCRRAMRREDALWRPVRDVPRPLGIEHLWWNVSFSVNLL